MAKQTITAHEFRQKLAALLKQQDYYTWEMSVVPPAAGQLGITGSAHYDVSGKAPAHRVVELEKLLAADYDIEG